MPETDCRDVEVTGEVKNPATIVNRKYFRIYGGNPRGLSAPG